MDMTWSKITPVNPKGEYLALLTYLPPRKQLAPHMGPTKFIRWKVAGSDVPLRWDVAIEGAKGEVQP